jgi:hypothetical protein
MGMLRQGARKLGAAALAAGAMHAAPSAALAQSIEPRAYAPAPTGVNFLIAGYAHAQGGPSIDTSIPLSDAKLDQNGAIFGYIRSLDLGGKPAKFDLIVPYGTLSGSAIYQGQPVQRAVEGFGDPLMRLSVILYGAPAMTASEFRSYRQDVIVGASLQVSAPWGRYDADKLLNLGVNRWAFKPEIGVSKAIGPWTLETQGAATFFTDNRDFFGGFRRSVSPLYSGQIHAIYGLRAGAWASLDATYFTGGRTTLDGIVNHDLERNWRLGLTLAAPVTPRASLKLNVSKGVVARTGNNYDLIGVAWQYRWGGGT